MHISIPIYFFFFFRIFFISYFLLFSRSQYCWFCLCYEVALCCSNSIFMHDYTFFSRSKKSSQLKSIWMCMRTYVRTLRACVSVCERESSSICVATVQWMAHSSMDFYTPIAYITLIFVANFMPMSKLNLNLNAIYAQVYQTLEQKFNAKRTSSNFMWMSPQEWNTVECHVSDFTHVITNNKFCSKSLYIDFSFEINIIRTFYLWAWIQLDSLIIWKKSKKLWWY